MESHKLSQMTLWLLNRHPDLFTIFNFEYVSGHILTACLLSLMVGKNFSFNTLQSLHFIFVVTAVDV